jgi:hypothetical protein
VDSNVYSQQPLSDLVKIPKWDMRHTRQVVKALDDSGLSIKKFSHANGLGYWRVMNAKRRLKAKTRHSTDAVTKPALVPVTVTSDSSASIQGSQRWVLEVDMGGCLVRVSKEASEQVLATTLRAVRELQC